MKKSLDAKRVNRNVKKLNKQLRADVFGNRFEARQIAKSRTPYGIEYFMYMLIDNEQPERNKIIPWETAFSIAKFNKIWVEMNDFIVKSDFWEKYNARREREDK